MHGTDGKVYRADLKPGNLYEGQEVYDLCKPHNFFCFYCVIKEDIFSIKFTFQ